MIQNVFFSTQKKIINLEMFSDFEDFEKSGFFQRQLYPIMDLICSSETSISISENLKNDNLGIWACDLWPLRLR